MDFSKLLHGFVKIDSRVSLSGIKACQDGMGHFFPTLPGGVGACQDGLGCFFSHWPV